MDMASIITLLLTGGVGMWLLNAARAVITDWLRSRGRIRSEKDALIIARSQWIERHAAIRIAAVRAGVQLPEAENDDEYDAWIARRHPPTPTA